MYQVLADIACERVDFKNEVKRRAIVSERLWRDCVRSHETLFRYP